ncbi:peroxidase [Lithospermum erythrorhizon]|uniref:Peroxidase n=1 Tax=Lithospermum erythrorhizon TaxID=34254 RepID=A0AAV3Q2R4_LITER
MGSSYLYYSMFLHCMIIVANIYSNNARASDRHLSMDYYQATCPNALEIIRKEMECQVLADPRNAALVLRLHFHDCFVQGCDASVLLDDTITLKGEKTAKNNINSLKGFELIDSIKNRLESECPGVVSCADTLTIAARDAVTLVGGPSWDVPLGRKDSKTAGYDLVGINIPSANEGILSIMAKFIYQGLSVTDMVALSGAHTLGMARCENYRARIYEVFSITSALNPSSHTYLNNLKSTCSPISGASDNNETSLDYATPNLFDNSYYHLLLKGEGLLNSDQLLYSSVFAVKTRKLVEKYALDPIAFFMQFSESMVKLGSIKSLKTFEDGEVRKHCRFINT